MPSGKLGACDPFVSLDAPFFAVELPSGRYTVKVTVADFSPEQDQNHLHEAYVSLIVGEGIEAERKLLNAPPDLPEGEFVGFGVDAGTCCFVDIEAANQCMPNGNWHEELFDTGKEDSWFSLMDAPEHIHKGIANIRLPLAKAEENLILSHSGWGDGVYPVIGGYDHEGKLLAVHIDLLVVPTEDVA